jgi:hypothetical protein
MCNGSIDNWDSIVIGNGSYAVVARINCNDRFFDGCSQGRPLASIMTPASFILSCPFP